MQHLFAATSNAGKLRDFAAAAEASAMAIEPLPGLKDIPAPPEDEPDFAGNARTKAIYYSRFAPGELVIADDSGLEVDALDGEPGVRSARFAEDARFNPAEASIAGNIDSPAKTIDGRNNLYLLSKLDGVPPRERSARYRCVLAAAKDGVCLFIGEGTVDGAIRIEPRGDGGFGYDPLFYLPALGRTMAEIDLAEKHRISHRGRALRALLASMFP
jgi:XTP/dITP diphosphohydrolase